MGLSRDAAVDERLSAVMAKQAELLTAITDAWRRMADQAGAFAATYRQLSDASGEGGAGGSAAASRQDDDARALASERERARKFVALKQWEVREREKLERWLMQATEQYNIRMTQTFAATIGRTLTQSYALVMEYLGALFTHAPMGMREFMADFLKLIGTAMIALGAALLFASQAWLSFFSGNWLGAVAASAALIVAGGAMVALSSALSRGSSGGSSSAAGASPARPLYTQSAFSSDGWNSSGGDAGGAGGGSATTINLTLNYGPTVGRRADGPELARAVMSALTRHGGSAAASPAVAWRTS